MNFGERFDKLRGHKCATQGFPSHHALHILPVIVRSVSIEKR